MRTEMELTHHGDGACVQIADHLAALKAMEQRALVAERALALALDAAIDKYSCGDPEGVLQTAISAWKAEAHREQEQP